MKAIRRWAGFGAALTLLTAAVPFAAQSISQYTLPPGTSIVTLTADAPEGQCLHFGFTGDKDVKVSRMTTELMDIFFGASDLADVTRFFRENPNPPGEQLWTITFVNQSTAPADVQVRAIAGTCRTPQNWHRLFH